MGSGDIRFALENALIAANAERAMAQLERDEARKIAKTLALEVNALTDEVIAVEGLRDIALERVRALEREVKQPKAGLAEVAIRLHQGEHHDHEC